MENIKNIIYPNVAAKNLILPRYSEEISHPATIGGEAQPVLSEGLYHYYFINPASSAVRSASAYIGGEEVEGVMEVAAALSKITEAFAEDIPEFEPYIGQYYDVATLDASSLEDGDFNIKYEANGSEVWLDLSIRRQAIYAPPTIAGENQPTVDGGSVFANFATKYPAQSLSVEADGVSFEASEVGVINEETVEAIPELSAYIGWTLYDATAEGFEDGEYTITITADEAFDDSLTFDVAEEEVDYLSFTAQEQGAQLSFLVVGTLAEPRMPDLKYSTDKTNWHQLAFTDITEEGAEEYAYLSNVFTLDLNETVYFKGTNPNGFSLFEDDEGTYQLGQFNADGTIAAGGDIGTITDEVGGADVVLADYCYESMFYGCTSLTAAPAQPATTLADGCYQNMFYGCTSLTTAPALPATSLADGCYSGMFYGCTSLTAAPALPATSLAINCYESMFYGCTSLTSAPSLPATTLAEVCYISMFQGCTALTEAPALPATSLAASCFSGMFYGCTSLTAAPSLPATSLADYCYELMFYGCTFAMSNDGTTFNFLFGATLPQTLQYTTYSTHLDVADWMGNTNGFTI